MNTFLISVSRSLGDRLLEDAISPVPYITRLKLQGNEKIVIATDGLWNVINNKEVFNMENEVKHFTLQQTADYLTENALYKGSKDNIIVIMISFEL